MKISYNVQMPFSTGRRTDWKTLLCEFENSNKQNLMLDFEGDAIRARLQRNLVHSAIKRHGYDMKAMVRNDKVYVLRKEEKEQ